MSSVQMGRAARAFFAAAEHAAFVEADPNPGE
jgi:hypothetical protein